jgi:acetoin utilization deacetylase AcuC-like enzyme
MLHDPQSRFGVRGKTNLLQSLMLLAVFTARGAEPSTRPKTIVVHDPVFMEHDTGAFHPEGGWRYQLICDALRTRSLQERIVERKPRMATDEEILLCHTVEYLGIVKRDQSSSASTLSTGDTPLSPRSLEVARYATGAVLIAVDAVLGGEAVNAFCPVRPPGHHAESARGMGFCIFNNVAIGARYAQKKHGIERVMILDIDVHHGNGTEEIFYSDPTVFVIGFHQSPLYPGTGEETRTGDGAGKGYNLNLPVRAGTSGDEVVKRFREAVLASAESFRPQLVMISAGFDALDGDPVGGLKLSIENYEELTRIAIEVANRFASRRLISVLEGGYHRKALGAIAAAHVQTLASP